MNLYQAHNQWKDRPADERFQSLQTMHDVCAKYRAQAIEGDAKFSELRVERVEDDLKLVGRTGVAASISHYAMGQLSQRVGAPATYLRSLPATLAAQNLNHGLKVRPPENNDAKMLFHERSRGDLVLRAATSDKYTRIWNADVTEKLLNFQKENTQWTNPMAFNIHNLKDEKTGDCGKMIPSGLYASDHDMFVFLVDESIRLSGSPEGLNRGFFMWNSEVGDKSFGGSFFLYDRVCGNNIVWGAEDVIEFKIRHVGSADHKAFNQIRMELKRYGQSSGAKAELMIKEAKSYILGGTKEQALDSLLKMASKTKTTDALTRSRLSEALSIAEKREDRYGDPRSLWAAVGGITEQSQQKAYADERMKIDRAAGKLLRTISF